MNEKKSKKISPYLIVFGILVVIIIAAALSTTLFNTASQQSPSGTANLSNYGPAPNIVGISGWINSQPLNISQLKGKVVLVDFWTYSCINCIRSIPHLNAWQSEYGGSNGLVIIGVSTPEFQFEHNYSNVYAAVKKFNITYPVALDNNYGTWDAYHNEYWPADYLVDANGTIRYEAFGEGDYNQTENAIRILLAQAGYKVPTASTSVPLGVNFSGIGSPEIYFGYATARQPLGGGESFAPNQTKTYLPQNITQQNAAYLFGSWYNAPDGMISVNNSRIYLVYYAKNVNIVASGVNGTNSTITLKVNGMNLNQSYLGADDMISNGIATATIGPSRLYNIVSAPSYSGWHELEIDASPGFKIYTFTFG
jgi:thiol-disulfide isomerase/thioredoxin